MARRKPARVERNRQQNERVRRTATQGDAFDGQSREDASNDAPEIIEIDDSNEDDADDVAQAATPVDAAVDRALGQWKRRRTGAGFAGGRFGRQRRRQVELQLHVGRPSQLSTHHAPWNETKRRQALWLTVPIEDDSLLRANLRELEASGALGAVARTAGTHVIGVSFNHEPDTFDELFGVNLDVAFQWLLQHDRVTMEIEWSSKGQKIRETGCETRTYAWRIGVAWLQNEGNVGSRSDGNASSDAPDPHMPHSPWAVRSFMTWLLYHSRRASAAQWQYPYEKEIDALYFQHISSEYDRRGTEFDIHEVYAKIDAPRQLQRDVANIPEDLTTSGVLLPTLRPYQKAALSWMLSRELPSRLTTKPLMTTRVSFPGAVTVLAPQEELLYDIFDGSFSVCSKENLPASHQPGDVDLSDIKGGILADEMGLGKTVEVIALVLSNPAPLSIPRLLTSLPTQDIERPSDEYALERDSRCVCGSSEDCAPGWVQCDLCSTWHHQVCTGYIPDRAADNPAYSKSIQSNTGTDSVSADTFICHHCQIQHHLVLSCKTTLIVSPEAIHDQWESELKRHVKPDSLRLLRYPGVKAIRSRLEGRGPSSEWQVLASLGLTMASYDIVLTTYEALASDLHHVPTEFGNDRRSSTRQKRKKYAFVASPLVFLKFWRVCMDEAQVGVENTQIQAALTVAQLQTELKWIVTGTPFSTQIADLYGCFKFLQVSPYSDKSYGLQHFRDQIQECFSYGAKQRVLDLLLWDGGLDSETNRHLTQGGGLLWRTRKKDVLSQLNLPEQRQEVIWCRFSDIERHFYNQKETEVVNMLEEQRRRRQDTVGLQRGLEEEVTENVWHHLLMLRQICCHPQVGQTMSMFGASVARSHMRNGKRKGKRSGVSGTNGASTGFILLTMEGFLQELIEKCRRECEEAQRKLIAANNGTASLALIRDDVATAIIKYLISIKVMRENWDDFRADLLPRLHVLENAAKCIRVACSLPVARSGHSVAATSSESTSETNNMIQDVASVACVNPKTASLMPDLPALHRSVSSGGFEIAETPRTAALAECQQLEASAERIRSFYLFEVEGSHTSALQNFKTIYDTIEGKLSRPRANGIRRDIQSAVKQSMLCSTSSWWMDALGYLQRVPEQGIVTNLVDRLRGHLFASGSQWAVGFAGHFHTVHGLSYALTNELVSLDKKRKTVYEKLLQKSAAKPTKAEIDISGNCKKCRDSRDGVVCWHCKFYKELEGYKQHMLGIDSSIASVNSTVNRIASSTADMYDDEHRETEMTTTTTVSTSMLLELLRQVASGVRGLLRANGSGPEAKRIGQLIQEGVQHEVEIWAQLLREWTSAKKLFQAQHQRLGALDELEMARMQIRLRYEDEVVLTATDKLYKLEPYEVSLKWAAFDADRAVADVELRQKKSQLRYLKHLQTARRRIVNGAVSSSGTMALDSADVENGSSMKETCVVCLEDIGPEHAVLPCAHVMCTPCSNLIANRLRSSNSIRCPTCRRIFSIEQRLIVRSEAVSDQSKSHSSVAKHVDVDDDVELIRGGFSSKIDAMLRRIVSLSSTNPSLKGLVFTQWQDMMNVIAVALQQNGIKCLTYTTKKQFYRVLQQFKLCAEPCVLILPFKVGANGLNIVEATEVLLIEPLLNTSIESQAINRVHRIGQTKQTRVHRFVVEDSVEERIHSLGTNKRKRTIDTSMIELDSDEAWSDVDQSLVVGRQERERLTYGDFVSLMGGRMYEDPGMYGQARSFWQQRVNLNGRALTRDEARHVLERRYAAEQRLADPSIAPSAPRTRLFSVEVNLQVAQELLSLHEASVNQENASESDVRALVEAQRKRVQHEIGAWQAASSTT